MADIRDRRKQKRTRKRRKKKRKGKERDTNLLMAVINSLAWGVFSLMINVSLIAHQQTSEGVELF